jgi:hypothetical protein
MSSCLSFDWQNNNGPVSRLERSSCGQRSRPTNGQAIKPIRPPPLIQQKNHPLVFFIVRPILVVS